jgi:hypothetical protein
LFADSAVTVRGGVCEQRSQAGTLRGSRLIGERHALLGRRGLLAMNTARDCVNASG